MWCHVLHHFETSKDSYKLKPTSSGFTKTSNLIYNTRPCLFLKPWDSNPWPSVLGTPCIFIVDIKMICDFLVKMFESCTAMPPRLPFTLDFSTRYVFTIFIKTQTRQKMLLVQINERGM